MVDLLAALHFRRVMREILVDGEVEVEAAALVHAFVGLDGQYEGEDVVRVRESGFHRFAKGAFEFCKVCRWDRKVRESKGGRLGEERIRIADLSALVVGRLLLSSFWDRRFRRWHPFAAVVSWGQISLFSVLMGMVYRRMRWMGQ